MEKYGLYKGLPVYTTTKEEYLKYNYFMDEPPSGYYIIIEDNVLVLGNRIVGDVYVGPDGSYNVDTKMSPQVYYKWKAPLFDAPSVGTEEEKKEEELSSADELLAGVYTSKLWED